VYDRCEDLPLFAGRYAYRQRGDGHEDEMARSLWYANNGFWHAGWEVNLGQQTGWLIVADTAPSPELIVGDWQLWDGGKLWPAPLVRCTLPEEGVTDSEVASAADELSDDILGDNAAAASIHLDLALPEHWHHRPEHLAWVGTYDRETLAGGEPTLINGRFSYALRRSPEKMVWWANGYWHAGLRHHLGMQTALLIAGDAAIAPEHIKAPWMNFEGGAWVPTLAHVTAAAGPARTQILRGLCAFVLGGFALCWLGRDLASEKAELVMLSVCFSLVGMTLVYSPLGRSARLVTKSPVFFLLGACAAVLACIVAIS
jgi:hypothetical protein